MEQPLEAQVTAALQVARIPEPSHRYAVASAPWPWFDDDSSSVTEILPAACDHKKCQNSCWSRYPQNIFPAWTPLQVERSGIKKAIMNVSIDKPSVIHRLDIIASPELKFTVMKSIAVEQDKHEPFAVRMRRAYTTKDEKAKDEEAKDKKADSVVRILFLETVTGSVLQILGTYLNISPSFFSSALNWTPAKYLDCVSPSEGDHLTVVLPFLHSISEENFVQLTSFTKYPPTSNHTRHHTQRNLPRDLHLIDTQVPLRLSSNQTVLAQDLLAVHVIRREVASTIITYHPKFGLPTTSAQALCDKINFAGQSTYWQGIMKKKCDPTLVLLMFMWHAVYGWDAAFEKLYSHICFLETRVMMASEMTITQELHILRAHNLHYASLLRDLRKTVEFISTHAHSLPEHFSRPDKYDKDKTIPIQAAVRLECVNLLESVERLEIAQKMHDDRLNNVMNLVFNTTSVRMTEVAVRDSAGKDMKQIAFLTMIFLPASFVSSIFGMNIQEVSPNTTGTFKLYVEAAIPLTAITIWFIVAFQIHHWFPQEYISYTQRLFWPVFLLLRQWNDRYSLSRVRRTSDHLV